MENCELPPPQGDALRPPPALECGDLSPLSPSGGLVRQTVPRPAARGEVAPRALDGDKSPPESGDNSPHSKIPWPHAPVHKLDENAVYFVTAGTLHKERFFIDRDRLDLLRSEEHTSELQSRFGI